VKVLSVYLSPVAEKKLELVLAFLEAEWGRKSRESFLKKLQKVVVQISKMPKSCPESSKMKGIFRCIITKHNALYYRIKEDAIEIITATDNRQDPAKVLKELEKYFK
jgi:plasmid stabilization system protein ParE